MTHARILILYSQTGAGHMRVAQVLSDQLRLSRPGWRVLTHEALRHARFGVGMNPSRIHAVLTVRMIWLFNFLYRIAERPLGLRFYKFLIRFIWGRQIGALIDQEKLDLVVSTHPFFSPSVCVTRGPLPRWVTVVTDLGRPPRAWFDDSTDFVVVATPEIKEYGLSLGGVNRVIALDNEYPVDNRFQRPAASRESEGSILIIGGGAGAGQIRKQVSILRRAFPTTRLVVVCGRHERLAAALSRSSCDYLQVYGFVDSLHELMQQADLIVTKAGPAAIVEAAIMGKPLVITGWVGLQERENVELVSRNRLGLYCPDPCELPEAIRRIRRESDSFGGRQQVFRQGSERIADLLASLVDL